MTTSGRSPFPAAATEWLVPFKRATVLAVGRSTAATAGRLRERNHRLTLLDRDPDGVRAMLRQAPAGLPVAGAADALPFAPYTFGCVVISQGLHRLAPGLALAEFARVLRPDGFLGVEYLMRDDGIPWVKRLIALLRAIDPEAMPGAYGSDSVEALAQSPYFVDLEQKNFRMWAPVTRSGLVEMVARTSLTQALDEAARDDLLAQVADLYDTSARAPEPLLLPYRVACWRARVDHTELSAPLNLPTEGLKISL